MIKRFYDSSAGSGAGRQELTIISRPEIHLGTVRCRVIAAFIALIVARASNVRADLDVFTDALAPGWQNWSWGTTTNFANASPAYGNTGSSVAVTYTAAWAGLYLHDSSIINASDYTFLRFQLHGGSTGGHHIRVVGYDAANAEGLAVSIPATIAGQWSQVDIPVSAFGINQISGLVWQDTSGAPQPVYYLDAIVFISGSSSPGAGPDLTVDLFADRHRISPLIYGMNFADAGLAVELRLPLNRWGGNATTRYNWQLDTSNHASDWYFENIPEANNNPGQLPNGSTCDRFIDANRLTNLDSIITVPLIGWTPKQRAVACGFSVAAYGPQQSVDPWDSDCGNGVRPDGSMISGNDPHDTSVAIDPSFVQGWIAHLIGRYGAASQGGVRFYDLDNETALWNSTHRDVHPQPVGYDEIRDRTFEYAAGVKAADSSAQTLGPVAWGWVEYFYSALDVAAGGSWWDTRPDRRAHGDMPLTDWYLQQMRSYEQSHGQRILDYLDLHYYPQGSGVALSPAGDAATQALRLRSTRSLWDPTYTDESWIADTVRLLPRMRDWVAGRYPGTKLAISEYNWGGLEDINGALAQADVLGIFGREGLDLATMWSPPQPTQPGAFAFRIYRNYDGSSGEFGDISVHAQSINQSQVSIFAASRADGILTLVIINKSNSALTSNLSLAHVTVLGPAKVYRYSAADPSRILRLADLPIASPMQVTFPAATITLLAIPGPRPADMNADGRIDGGDVQPFVNCLVTGISNCGYADIDGNGLLNASDVSLFVGKLLEP